MINDNFSKKLEDLEIPQARLPEQERRLRLAFVNAKKAAWWGLVLVLLPATFIFINILNEWGIGLPYNTLAPFYKAIDIPIVSNLVFLGGLILAVILNLLSILHISFTRNRTEFGIEIIIKRKFWNILIIVIIVAVVGFLAIYLVGENIKFVDPHTQ